MASRWPHRTSLSTQYDGTIIFRLERVSRVNNTTQITNYHPRAATPGSQIILVCRIEFESDIFSRMVGFHHHGMESASYHVLQAESQKLGCTRVFYSIKISAWSQVWLLVIQWLSKAEFLSLSERVNHCLIFGAVFVLVNFDLSAAPSLCYQKKYIGPARRTLVCLLSPK